MIGFRDNPAVDPSRAFLVALRERCESMSPAVLRTLAEVLSSHEEAEDSIVQEVATWSDDEVTSFLEGCWKSGLGETLGLAGSILGRRGTTGLVPWLENIMSQPGGSRWLADVLGVVHDDDSTRLLIGFLDHGDRSIRHRAADALASHRSTLDVRAFVRYLADPIVHARPQPSPLTLLRALHRIADSSLEPDFGHDAARRAERVLINCVHHEKRAGVRGDAIAALGDIGSRSSVRCLVDMLNREDRAFHREVVIALRKIHPDRAFMALVGLLHSPDPIVREEAANALGEIGDPKAVSRIRALLEDENPDVRQEAVLALGKLGGIDVLNALERALSDPDPQVRTMACSALAESVGTEAQGKLIRALYDGSADVRSEAAYHLGNIGDENARQHLEGCLGDDERDAFGDRVGSIARKSLFRLAYPRLDQA